MYTASKRLICRWFILKNTSATDSTNPSNDAEMNNMGIGPISMSMQVCNIKNNAIWTALFMNTMMSDLPTRPGEFLQLFG
jgi:hypothetical protein